MATVLFSGHLSGDYHLSTVIAIISLLAAFVAPNIFRNLAVAKDVTARSQIEMLAAALDSYRLDNGRYPSTSQGLRALWEEPTEDPKPRNWRGPYLRKPPPSDPWDSPYVYRAPSERGLVGFDLLSYGADGVSGGEGEAADISLWGS